MKDVFRGTSLSLAAVVLAAVASACEGPDRLPPTTLVPPVIEIVGLVASQSSANDTFHFMLTDGRSFTVSTANVRMLGDGGFGLIILGSDRDGRFLGGFPTQGGLPADCYVENARGVDRGAFVELRGVLWRKSPYFVPAQFVRPDHPYPGATRFCFDVNGLVASTVAP